MPAINTHWHENRLWRLSFAAPAINTVVPAAWHDNEELQFFVFPDSYRSIDYSPKNSYCNRLSRLSFPRLQYCINPTEKAISSKSVQSVISISHSSLILEMRYWRVLLPIPNCPAVSLLFQMPAPAQRSSATTPFYGPHHIGTWTFFRIKPRPLMRQLLNSWRTRCSDRSAHSAQFLLHINTTVRQGAGRPTWPPRSESPQHPRATP